MLIREPARREHMKSMGKKYDKIFETPKLRRKWIHICTVIKSNTKISDYKWWLSADDSQRMNSQ